MFLRSKWLIVGFLGLLGMVIPFFIFGATIFEDNFETYNLGALSGQGGWYCPEGGTPQYPEVINTIKYEGNQGIYWDNIVGLSVAKTGTLLSIGSISFWFRIEILTDNDDLYHPVFLMAQDTDTRFKITYRCNFTTHLCADGIEIYSDNGTDLYFLNIIMPDTWNNIELEWDAIIDKYKVKLNFGNWSDWLNLEENEEMDFINKLRLYRVSASPKQGIYFDKISDIIPPSCETDCNLCETWLTCENANCCWYYSTWLQQGSCEECPTGECGEGFWTEACNNCLNQEDCEAVENCYWKENFCKFGTGKCGEGIELQFCENQEDCEEKGGYWYDNYCWLEPKPIFIDWGDYYNEYGDYEEPLAWINDLAQSTNKFYESIGGFLTAFKKIFDLKEAHQRGSEFGNSIPVARGYLATLNNFAGGLPFGEFFVFLLAFMIVIGIFRLIRNLIQMIKFW